ncbi:hypothetical protein PILCRDRAFT_819579 [Piloderma croceum F 1598]|uniref:Uncharacterized protein n=1 Tax=Piloderma croceum (strain F 1598) TaxID=765440 RepID=A0A0C3BAK6_PILCF|nr:hypothetical protein PILCRDRAFT_819579 [Piloderma croceum F 1598]
MSRLGCMACSMGIAMITGNPCEISSSHVGHITSWHYCISQYPSVVAPSVGSCAPGVAFELKRAQWMRNYRYLKAVHFRHSARHHSCHRDMRHVPFIIAYPICDLPPW